MKLTAKIIKQIIGNKGRIFNVTFTKKDGSTRSFNARLGVHSYASKTGGGRKYDPSDYNMIGVFSLDDLGYRTVSVDNLIRLKANGLEIVFN
jgi:hypothetical protein